MADGVSIAKGAAIAAMWFAFIGGVFVMWLDDEPEPVAEPTPVERIETTLAELRINCSREIEALGDKPARQREVEAICEERTTSLELELEVLGG